VAVRVLSELRALECCLNRGGDREGRPGLSDGLRLYAIGDVHGRLDLLDICLAGIDADIRTAGAEKILLLFLGDYIDRGPASRQVVERLLERARQSDCIFLKGNHEEIFLSALKDVDAYRRWLRWGGLETIVSYGVKATFSLSKEDMLRSQEDFAKAVPSSHLGFFQTLRSHFSCGDFFFAHAGVRPGVELGAQHEQDLFWIRDEFLNSDMDFGKIVVHGHTPASNVEARSNRINLDTGAYYSNRLSCLVIEGQRLSILQTVPPSA
jgi:serine/threonine protein phosphatase 1